MAIACTTIDPILKRFRKALEQILGGRIERGMLSSPARGDTNPDLDYDVAIV